MEDGKVHWFLIVHPNWPDYSGSVEGRCSDGRTFEEPTRDPLEWVRGFSTHCNMSGQTVEVRK